MTLALLDGMPGDPRTAASLPSNLSRTHSQEEKLLVRRDSLPSHLQLDGSTLGRYLGPTDGIDLITFGLASGFNDSRRQTKTTWVAGRRYRNYLGPSSASPGVAEKPVPTGRVWPPIFL